MASWMVHLRLAEDLIARIDHLSMRPFALGSIAPDSGIPDTEWKTYDPPKEVTHFKMGGLVHDMDFYRGYLQPADPADERFSYLLGYFFHLITDNLWNRQIWLPTKQRWQAELDADSEYLWEIKRDWYGLDFCYLRDHPDFPIWHDFLQIDTVPNLLDFLPVEGIRQNVSYIQTFYQRAFDPADERAQAAMQRPFIYLAPAEMDRFVRDSADALHAIYQLLWIDRVDPADAPTALDLIADPLPLSSNN